MLKENQLGVLRQQIAKQPLFRTEARPRTLSSKPSHTGPYFRTEHTLLTGSPKSKADSKTSKVTIIKKYIHASWNLRC